MSLTLVNDPGAHCSMLRQFVHELEWRPEQHIYPGMPVEFRCHKRRAFGTWTFMRSEIAPGDITFRCMVNPTVSQRRLNWECVVVRAVFRYGVRRGEPVRLSLTAIPGIWAGVDTILSVWVGEIPNNFNPDAELPPPRQEAGSECRLPVVAGPVERLSVYARPAPEPDGRIRVCLVPEDRFGNPGRFAGEVPVACAWQGETWQETVQGPTVLHVPAPTETARLTAAVPLAALQGVETVANGRREGGDFVVTGNPVWPAAGERRAVFGEFHWHTDFSGDGQRPIREAIRCARDELNLDYLAPGDHNPRGPAWEGTVEALEEAEDPGAFATFFGWENGTARGHENYYFTDPAHPLICNGEAGIRGGYPDANVETLRRLWEERGDFVVIPHHTNAVAETRKLEDDSPFWHPYPWGEPQPYERAIEIMQTRGNQERNDYQDVWRGWHQHQQASAQDALALGYRLGFTGGTDNHCGWPGRAYAECEQSGVHEPKSVILTGLWTEERAREPVFHALQERRCWAVWDTRALVDFRVQDVPAGGELSVAAGTELTADLRLSAEDALRVIEIVRDGEVVWSGQSESPDVELSVPLGAATATTYVYLRALEHKGGIIYASPVFVTVA